MRTKSRFERPSWILATIVLALVGWSAGCAEGSEQSTSGTSTSTSGTGGSTGGGGNAGSSGTTSTGGTAGSAGSTGGVAGSTGGSGGTAGSGGMGGVGGTGGVVVGGGGAGGCGPTEKICFNICVPNDDPKFGCADPSCNECSNQNATPGCVAGECSIIKCEATFADCDGSAANGCEVSLPNDPMNCGACGAECVVPHATPGCMNEVCTVAVCDAPWTDCDGDVLNGCESNTQVDTDNCGACNSPCAPGEQCQDGACGVFCPLGKANCDGNAVNGCETDLGTVVDCAFCGDACQLANSSSDCQVGACVITACDANHEDCDGAAANGCEVNTETSADNCGACGTACPSGPNSTAVCTSGSCDLVCAGGFENCNNNASDGCEQPILTDTSNCGGCNNVCVTPNATPTCTAGSCQVAMCNPGFADCNQATADGCEVNVTNTVAHCGSCGNTCPSPANATPNCAGGMCGFTCLTGFADCDGLAANGCEVDLLNDHKNCGSCNSACSLANATAGCAAGACTVAMCTPGFANCDNIAVNGCEINLKTDVLNCGVCGTVCNLANSDEVCSGGVCTVGNCTAPFANCDNNDANGCEVNTDSSVGNCGACGNTCVVANGTPACATGQCLVASCNSGFANCDNNAANGCEVNLNTSVGNCGACGNVCDLPNANEGCSAGSCTVASCLTGFANCDNSAANGCEVNLNTSVGNCGACGNTCNIANANEACVSGACTIASCNAPFANCDNLLNNGCEVNTDSSVANCGACGSPCTTPNGTPACSSGQCLVSACNAGFANCDGVVSNGCEINTNTNVGNCGSCGNVCNLANATEACSAGACAVASCDAGFANCDNQAANGCEINLQNSVGNCGSCGNVCNLANANEACVSGSCGIATCNAPFDNCDGIVSNGCEVNTDSNVANCGACGSPCVTPNGTPACSTGQCLVSACNVGFANCDGQVANGCEINTTNNVSNCGACGNVCNLANATEACTGGACAVSACDAGYTNCDNQPANGCEIQTSADVNNCGACGNVCNLANATEACTSGACAIASCNSGFGNCDNDTATGCEVNLNTSLANCGGCGNTCAYTNAAESCSNGSCLMGACDSGWGNCDNNNANGCEVNLDTTLTSCGSCGNTCNLPNAAETCTGGTCQVASCDMPFANCDNNPANGCEINLTSNANNCGGCGNVCNLPNAVPACAAGMCAIGACLAGFADCDGNPMNGCEVNIGSDLNNCGGCGTVCAPANAAGTCSAGTCQVASCNSSFANCNGLPGDGCEVNTNTSLGNCGGCGQICAPANAAGACSAGSCTIATCNSGFANCNGSQGDGCEINTQADVQNCGTCGNNCAVSCAGNTSLTQCTSGACAIQSCQPGYYNVDGLCSGGCECQASGVSQSCASPQSLGTVNIGQTVTTSANLVPNGVEAWYTVTFTGNTNASYHPRVRLTTNPGSAYQFDIRTNCAGGTIACGTEGGVSNAVTDWETFVTGTAGYYNPIPPVGNNGTILIHVFRKAGQPLSCSPFTLSVSN
ncbi:MAG: hypothetical protein IPK82_25040 [Polyangiaceae bacterium]|nr:hypothetical protein [Polyangiaceae bacterium]